MKWFSLQACLLLAATIAGCRNGTDQWEAGRPATAPAEGVLTYKGAGVDGATIFLVQSSPGKESYTASAMTGSDGSFSLAAFPPDEGAVPGSYKVGVTKLVTPPMPEGPGDSHDSDNTAPPSKNHLPQKYANPTRSGLTLEIPESGKTDIKIELED